MFPQNVSTKLSHKQAIRISLLNLQLLFVFSFQSRKWLAYLFSIRCALCSTSLSATLATFSLLNPHKHPSCFCASNRRILNSYISLYKFELCFHFAPSNNKKQPFCCLSSKYFATRIYTQYHQ